MITRSEYHISKVFTTNNAVIIILLINLVQLISRWLIGIFLQLFILNSLGFILYFYVFYFTFWNSLCYRYIFIKYSLTYFLRLFDCFLLIFFPIIKTLQRFNFIWFLAFNFRYTILFFYILHFILHLEIGPWYLYL